MINAYLDEFGRRKMDGLLEDGTKIIIVGVGVTYEIYVDAITQSLASHLEQTTFNVEKDASVISQADKANWDTL